MKRIMMLALGLVVCGNIARAAETEVLDEKKLYSEYLALIKQHNKRHPGGDTVQNKDFTPMYEERRALSSIEYHLMWARGLNKIAGQEFLNLKTLQEGKTKDLLEYGQEEFSKEVQILAAQDAQIKLRKAKELMTAYQAKYPDTEQQEKK